MWQQLPRDLKFLLFSTIMANIGGSIIEPFMAIYLTYLGADIRQVGLFFTVNTLSVALLRPLGGWFSDAIGRIQAVAFGTVFGLLGHLGYALAPSWQWLIVASLVLAVGRSIVGPSFQAYTAESAPPGRTAETFGFISGLYTICQILGPLIAGWLAARYQLNMLFWIAWGFMLVASALRIWPAIGREFLWHKVNVGKLKGGVSSMWLALLGGGLLTWLFVTDSVRDFGVQLYQSFQPLFMEGQGVSKAEIGYLFSIAAVVYLLITVFASRLADKLGPASALTSSGFLLGGALLMVAIWPTRPVILLYVVLSATAFGLADPAFDALLAKASSTKTLGLTFGLFSTAISIVSVPAPYLGSLLWEQTAPPMPFAAGGVVMLCAGLLTAIILPSYLAKQEVKSSE